MHLYIFKMWQKKITARHIHKVQNNCEENLLCELFFLYDLIQHFKSQTIPLIHKKIHIYIYQLGHGEPSITPCSWLCSDCYDWTDVNQHKNILKRFWYILKCCMTIEHIYTQHAWCCQRLLSIGEFKWFLLAFNCNC